jgi:hypothetical protein
MTSHEPTIAELTAKAKVLDRLVAHLDKRNDVQNIDLMILAGFCRNCLSKWYLAEANEQGLSISKDDAYKAIYGMDYQEWKATYQAKATEEQMAAFNNISPEQTS